MSRRAIVFATYAAFFISGWVYLLWPVVGLGDRPIAIAVLFVLTFFWMGVLVCFRPN